MDLPHTKSIEEVLEYYKVTETEGLSEERVKEQRQKYGYNGDYGL